MFIEIQVTSASSHQTYTVQFFKNGGKPQCTCTPANLTPCLHILYVYFYYALPSACKQHSSNIDGMYLLGRGHRLNAQPTAHASPSRLQRSVESSFSGTPSSTSGRVRSFLEQYSQLLKQHNVSSWTLPELEATHRKQQSIYYAMRNEKRHVREPGQSVITYNPSKLKRRQKTKTKVKLDTRAQNEQDQLTYAKMTKPRTRKSTRTKRPNQQIFNDSYHA